MVGFCFVSSVNGWLFFFLICYYYFIDIAVTEAVIQYILSVLLFVNQYVLYTALNSMHYNCYLPTL